MDLICLRLKSLALFLSPVLISPEPWYPRHMCCCSGYCREERLSVTTRAVQSICIFSRRSLSSEALADGGPPFNHSPGTGLTGALVVVGDMQLCTKMHNVKVLQRLNFATHKLVEQSLLCTVKSSTTYFNVRLIIYSKC